MSELFLKGLIVHLAADWFLQSDWMAQHKTSLYHPAAWVHSGIHTLGYLLVLPANAALALGISHLLIDTRKPLIWLRALFAQKLGAYEPAFELWQDQAAHLILLALVALLAAG
ncbi:MAG: DUF3307 domain-containing protein [Anaerolineales bacterium]|nr:DUF3307 domain-containing protein [Anaerolineales bacterium]